jgi:DNA-binding NarL/FixJ family response regulator
LVETQGLQFRHKRMQDTNETPRKTADPLVEAANSVRHDESFVEHGAQHARREKCGQSSAACLPIDHRQLAVAATEKGPKQRRGKARVLIVDDHPIICRGFAALINQEADLVACGEASTVQDTLKLLPRAKPHLVTTDIKLRDPDGIGLIKEIKSRYPDVLILVVSTHDESVYAERALRAGARGYIMKSESVPQIMAAIRKVLSGGIHVSARFAESLLHCVAGSGSAPGASPIGRLTDRELQILDFIGQGLRSQDIAQNLCLSVKTIESHREHIKQKLNLRHSNELLRFAVNQPRAG